MYHGNQSPYLASVSSASSDLTWGLPLSIDYEGGVFGCWMTAWRWQLKFSVWRSLA